MRILGSNGGHAVQQGPRFERNSDTCTKETWKQHTHTPVIHEINPVLQPNMRNHLHAVLVRWQKILCERRRGLRCRTVLRFACFKLHPWASSERENLNRLPSQNTPDLPRTERCRGACGVVKPPQTAAPNRDTHDPTHTIGLWMSVCCWHASFFP